MSEAELIRHPRRVGVGNCTVVEGAFLDLLNEAEPETCERDGLRDTPARAAKAWSELTSGYDNKPKMTVFPAEGADGIVAIRRIPFYSLCEHHALPFFGTVDFAYIPAHAILGLSKFARLTEHFSRRLQVQERLTSGLAHTLNGVLSPQGVMVIVRAQHLCMMMRGVEAQGAETITSEALGAFRDNVASRAEAMELLR